MNLYQLAFTCYIYNTYTSFNRTYKLLQEEVKYKIDLSNIDHRKKLIAWLNKWGCRQFSLAHHELASQEILAWFNNSDAGIIPQDKKNLWELTEAELDVVSNIYDSLSNRTACKRVRKNTELTVTVGATGASKILFVLRPNIAVPWDSYIRKGLHLDGDGKSYIKYLKRINAEIESLKESCNQNGIQLHEVPEIIGRSSSTLPQLVGEYFWVTETKQCYPPPADTIQQWVKWGQ